MYDKKGILNGVSHFSSNILLLMCSKNNGNIDTEHNKKKQTLN